MSSRTPYRPAGRRSRSLPRSVRVRSRGIVRGSERQPFNASSLPTFQDTSLQSSSDPRTPSPSLPRTDTPLSSSDGISLETVVELCKDTLALVTTINTRLSKAEENNVKLTSTVKELKDYMKKFCKNSFVVKGSQYEAPIKREMARLFCLSLKRKPLDQDIQAAVTTTLGRYEPREKHKYDLIYAFAKSKLTEYRTEERRKVVGIPPYEKYCYHDTNTLHSHIIGYMQADLEEDDQTTYVKHLALLRKFVRDTANVPSTNFYGAFREWVDAFYANITGDTWTPILREDEDLDYAVVGNGIQSDYHEEEVISEDISEDIEQSASASD